MQLSSPQLSHCASAECAVAARTAYEFLCDGIAVGRWALGAFDTRRIGRNLYQGTSLFDGKPFMVKPVGDRERLLVDYFVGTHAARLASRMMARAFRRTRNSCIVSLVAWRVASMDQARWERLTACHEVEVLLIQALLSRK